MGAGRKLTLPTHKVLMGRLEEVLPIMESLTEATAGRSRERLRVPAGIASTIKSFPKLLTWIEKNRVSYEKFLANYSTGETTPTKTRTRGASA
jgi:hypothetical protein